MNKKIGTLTIPWYPDLPYTDYYNILCPSGLASAPLVYLATLYYHTLALAKRAELVN